MPPKPSLTHFLCLPLVSETSRPQLEKSMAIFRQAMMSRPEFAGLSPRFIRPIGSIHLTLGVMSLADASKVQAAVDFLEGLNLEEILRRAQSEVASKEQQRVETSYAGSNKINLDEAPAGTLPMSTSTTPELTVRLTGLKSLAPPSSTSSLSASPRIPPSATAPLLQAFSEKLRQSFLDASFLVPEPPHRKDLKLHATVLNTLYASNAGGHGGRGRFNKVRKVDVRDWLGEWENFEWFGERGVRIERVAICKMGARKVHDENGKVVDEAYEEVAASVLPS